jgi:hypothetical protein
MLMGLARVEELMKLLISTVIAASFALGGVAFAEKPADPGGFGKDRAAYIQTTQGTGAPGASEVGKILSDRAGDNGTINNEYKCAKDQVPDSAAYC